MSQDLLSALKPLIDRLQGLAARDEELRAFLRAMGNTLLALVEEPVAQAPTAPAEPDAVPEPVAPLVPLPAKPLPPIPVAAPPYRDEPAPAFLHANDDTDGHALPVQGGGGSRPILVTDEDLPLIDQRCRLKAEGSRWAIQRQQLIKEKANFYTEIDPKDRDLIARAKTLPYCFLWMCHRDAPVPSDPSLFNDLAGCYEAAAACALVFARLTHRSREKNLIEEAIILGAEVQSALRVAVARVGGYQDGDQIKLYVWVKTLGQARAIWIARFMLKDDPADPTAWRKLLERIKEISEKIDTLDSRDKRQVKLVSKIRHHVKRVQTMSEVDHVNDWQTIVTAVSELVDAGLPPSNIEIRDLLLPVIDDLPEMELPKAFQSVLREIDRYLALPAPKEDEPVRDTTTKEVREVAEILRGRALVLIGGERRPQAAEAITTAFGLSELIWLEGREHQSHVYFQPEIARPEVAAVLLAIRWSSHGFGEVKEFCDAYGKPLVRLRRGYSPNQVAFEILAQISDRLIAKT